MIKCFVVLFFFSCRWFFNTSTFESINKNIRHIHFIMNTLIKWNFNNFSFNALQTPVNIHYEKQSISLQKHPSNQKELPRSFGVSLSAMTIFLITSLPQHYNLQGLYTHINKFVHISVFIGFQGYYQLY